MASEYSETVVREWPEDEWMGDFCAGFKCPNCGEYLYVTNEEFSVCDCGLALRFRVELIKRSSNVEVTGG
jgi:hypothetical protein